MQSQTRTSRGRNGGFTIIELSIVILVILALMGLLIVGAHHVMAFAKGTGDRAAVTSLKQGVTQFREQMGFLPPLVKDNGSTSGGPDPIFYSTSMLPQIYLQSNPTDLSDLRGGMNDAEPGTTPVYSIYSLPYYLIGVLDSDGVPGPGFKAVRRDGSFEKAGRTFNPFFDPRRADAIFEQSPLGHGRIELRDSHGTPYRYYRWLHDDGQPNMNNPLANPAVGLDATKVYLNVPRILYDPNFYVMFSNLSPLVSPPLPPDMRDAEYAIVGAGPNGVFGDETPQILQDKLSRSINISDPAQVAKLRTQAWSDNIVEVGR